MKFSPIFVLLAASAPIIAHAQTEETPAVAASVAPLPMAPKTAETADAFVWRFAPPVGSRWTMRSFVRSTSNTQVPAVNGEKAQSMNFKIIQKMTADYDVLSRDEWGATTIRLTLREMENDVTVASDGKSIKSPLAKPDSRAVDGATLTIKQSREGKVWGVVGMRAFQRKILEASGSLDAATINQVLDANPMTGNNVMMKSMSLMSGTLPTSPVRVSESWNYDVKLPSPLAFDISGTRTLKSLNPDVAVVADSASYTGDQAQMKFPKTPQMPGFSIDYSQIKGYVNGVSRVQRSSGLPLESTVNQTIKGSISTQIPATNGAPAQKITVPMDATSSGRVVLEPR